MNGVMVIWRNGIPSLAAIARSDSAFRELAQWLAYGSDVRHLKQEAVEPRRP